MDYKLVENKAHIPAVMNFFRKGTFGLDIETNNQLFPRKGLIRTIQMSDGEKTVIIDLKTCFPQYWNGESIADEPEIKVIGEVLSDNTVKKIIQNASFELSWFKHHFNIDINNLFDTMVADQIIDYEERHNLAAIARRHLKIKLDKTEQNADWTAVLTVEKLEYAALDVYHLNELADVLHGHLVEYGLTDVADMEFDLIQPLVYMQLSGIKVNREKYKEKIVLIEDLHEKARANLMCALGDGTKVTQMGLFGESKDTSDINPSSPSQIKRVLQKKGVPIIDADWWEVQELHGKTVQEESKEEYKARIEDCVEKVRQRYAKQRKPFAESTGKTLLPLVQYYPKVLKPLVEFRGAEKMLSSYGDSFFQWVENAGDHERVFAGYRAIGAATGRMSCSKPNIQQVSKKPVSIGGEEFNIGLREAFDYRAGYKGVNADYAQIELRVLAEFSRDPVMLEVFLSGKDPHSMTGALILGMDYDKFLIALKDAGHSSHEDAGKKREFAKRVNFGTVYGIGSKGLSDQLNCSQEEAQSYIDIYAKGYEVAWKFLEMNANNALRNLETRSMLGRRQLFRKPGQKIKRATERTTDYFLEEESGTEFVEADERKQAAAIKRNGRNMPIQSTAGDIMKWGTILLHRSLQKYFREGDANLVSIVHDEVTVEAYASIAENVRQKVELALIKGGERFLKTVPVVVEAKIVDNWGQK